MEIEILTDRDDPQFAEDFARAARSPVAPDEAEVEAFYQRLTGLLGDDDEEVFNEVEGLRLPAGYLHIRVFDGGELASLVIQRERPPTASEVTLLVTLHERFETARWVATTPLPNHDRGVLDLLIHFEDRIAPTLH